MSSKRLEFGGPAGALAIMLASHVAVYYLHLCVEAAGGDLYSLPRTLAGLRATWADLRAHATPTFASWCAYLGFLAHQAILALVCPGPVVLGYPCSVPPGERRARGVVDADDEDADDKDADDKDAVPKVRLAYTCNALAAWWCTLGTVAVAVAAFGDAPLVWVADRRGELLTCAVITADLASLAAYAHATLTGAAESTTGQPAYDLFMGAARNPRAFGGKLDWKMWTELRVSWVTLFLLTLASAAKARRRFGAVDPSSAALLLAHWLYANACQKGEESVPFTWDVFHEKWGWMLIFWNLAGVPFAYSVNAAFVASRGPGLKPGAARLLALFLLAAYYVWDTAQSQRTRFRARRQGTYVHRPLGVSEVTVGHARGAASDGDETRSAAPRQRMGRPRAKDSLHRGRRHGDVLGGGVRIRPVDVSRAVDLSHLLRGDDRAQDAKRRAEVSRKIRRRLGRVHTSRAARVDPGTLLIARRIANENTGLRRDYASFARVQNQ